MSTTATAESSGDNSHKAADPKKCRPLQSKAEKEELALIEKRLSCEADLKVKFLLVGSSLVGKTSLASKFANSQADIGTLKPTMAGDFHHFTVDIGGKHAHVRVWDMGGAEKFHQTDLVLDFYRDVDAILLVFAMDNFESFTQLPVWLELIAKNQSRHLSQLDCCLLANKADLSEKRMISTREATDFASYHGLPYIEASALTADNVQKAFRDLVLAVARRRQLLAEVEASPLTAAARKRRAGRRGLDFRALCCGCGDRALPER